MRAGSLNRRITIQARTTGQDAYGEPLTGWTDVANVWADIEDATGNQMIAAQAILNPVETKITIRYRLGVTAAMRVLHKTDVYDITAVLGQDRRTMELLCKRGVNNG